MLHSFRGTGKTFTYKVTDEFGDRTLIVPPEELPHSGDPGPIVLDIEARTRTRLKDSANPCRFIRAWQHFRERRAPNSPVSFAEFCARRHAAWIDVLQSLPDDAVKKTKRKAKKPKQRRKRITDREREVLSVYSECGRNAAEAGRQLNVTKQYVWRVAQNALAKVESASASGCSKRPDQTLPTDSDGQECISEQLGKADTTRSRKPHVRKRF